MHDIVKNIWYRASTTLFKQQLSPPIVHEFSVCGYQTQTSCDQNITPWSNSASGGWVTAREPSKGIWCSRGDFLTDPSDCQPDLGAGTVPFRTSQFPSPCLATLLTNSTSLLCGLIFFLKKIVIKKELLHNINISGRTPVWCYCSPLPHKVWECIWK